MGYTHLAKEHLRSLVDQDPPQTAIAYRHSTTNEVVIGGTENRMLGKLNFADLKYSQNLHVESCT